jgi:hypothetical protein
MAALRAYAVPYPANQHPADLAAATSTYSAPDIPANAAMNTIDLIHAARETRSKKRARDEGKVITDNEYTSALVRQHAIESEHARVVYGGVAGVPQWGEALKTTLDNFIETMNAFVTTSKIRLIRPSFLSDS